MLVGIGDRGPMKCIQDERVGERPAEESVDGEGG